jgi:hypothetical protein
VTEPSTELAALHTAITELAAIVAGARAALRRGAGRAGNQLEMAEMDLLSARSAIEKACFELDFEPPTAGDVSRSVRPARPVRVPRMVRSSPTPDGRADRVVEHPDKDNANCSRYPPPTTSGDPCMERERALS